MTVAYLVVLAPIVGQLVRKINSPWRPTGDDAIFAINAHDVFSWRPPLLGTYSVVAQVGNESPPLVYHLGPMVSWVLAIPERLFGERLGIAFGAAIVNALMLLAVVWVVRRVFDERAAVGAAIAIVLMAWSVGHSTLAEPWNPYIGLWALPLVCALACAVAAGRRWAFAWLIVVASFAVQAHYLYLAIVAAVVAACVFTALFWPHFHRPKDRPIGSLRWSFVAVVVCWAPTVLQQLFGNPGNLSNWFRATTRATDSKSDFFDFSFRYVVNALGAPGLTLRGPLSALDQLKLTRAPSVIAWLTAAGVVAFVIFVAVYFRSRQPNLSVFALVTTAVAFSTTLTISQLPMPLFLFPYYRIVMLWFASTMVWMCAVCGVGSLVATARRAAAARASKPEACNPRQPNPRVAILMVAALMCASVAVASTSSEGPVDLVGARATGQMSAQGRAQLDRNQRYVVVGGGARGVFAAYGVFRELRNAGFAVYVPNDEVQLRRAYAIGARSANTLMVQSGVESLPDNAVLITSFDGRSAAERKHYETLRAAAAAKAPGAEQAFEAQRFGFEQLQFRLYLLPQ